jgi:anti-sigma B factor antagonist
LLPVRWQSPSSTPEKKAMVYLLSALKTTKTTKVSMRGFTAEISDIEGGVIVHLSGELDAGSSVIADNAIEESIGSGIKTLLIDCTELSYISSAGLGVLLSSYQACRQADISFILYALNAKIQNVFEIVGLHNVMTITDTKEEAIAKAIH